ncbi:MAG TPA: cardiolipin synthase [Spirochaetota bacterium]
MAERKKKRHISFLHLKKYLILPEFLREMKRLSIGGLSGGNNTRIIIDGDVCYDSFLADMKKAKKSINLETFVFRSDKIGWLITELLVEKAKAGVEVNVIYDAIGSIGASQMMFNYMKRNGVEVIEYHPFLPWRKYFNITLRDHRKILVIDGKIAYVGGINIGKEYAGIKYNGGNWRDTHLRIEGPAVKEIQFFFIENWYRQGGSIIQFDLHFPAISKKGNTLLMIISTRSRKKIQPIIETYYSAISTAKKSIYITNAYFVPDRKMHHAIVKAAHRGVDVRILVPGVTNIPIVKYASRYLYKYFLRHNVRIYEYQKSTLHAKTAVIDGVLSTIGSSNLDRQSLYTNLEVNATILDDRFGNRMNRIFMDDLRYSREINRDSFKRRHAKDFFLEWLSYRFRNIL